MVKEIIWSPLAVETYKSIIDYLIHKFGEATAKKFVQRVDDRISLIATRPRMFRATNKRPNTYITSIIKKVTLTYRYKPYKKQLELVVFWGRQDLTRKVN